MAKTFHLEIKKEPTSKGLYPVYIRITENRKSKRIKTSIELKRLTDWNPNTKNGKYIKASEPNSVKWNDVLEQELERCKDIYREDKSQSIDSLKQTYKRGEESESFLDFIKQKVEEIQPSVSIGTYRHYKTLIQKITDYLASNGRVDISFNEVNVSFLKGFESYLGRVKNKRNFDRTLERCTIAEVLKNLRKLVNDAIKEGKISNNDNPFINFSISRGDEPQKEKLEEEEIQRLIELELTKGTFDWHVRNAFLFSFYCAGIRVGDVMQMRWANVAGGELSYQMDKNGKIRNYELVDRAKQILDYYRTPATCESDYIFPFLDNTAEWAVKSYKSHETMPDNLKHELFAQIASKSVLINRSLKLISAKAHINKKVTFHTSRHSFAHLAMQKGLSSKAIQTLLAHGSVKTTERYMGAFSSKETNEALKQVFSKSKDKREEASSIISALKDADADTIEKIKQLLSIK